MDLTGMIMSSEPLFNGEFDRTEILMWREREEEWGQGTREWVWDGLKHAPPEPKHRADTPGAKGAETEALHGSVEKRIPVPVEAIKPSGHQKSVVSMAFQQKQRFSISMWKKKTTATTPTTKAMIE